MSAEVVVEAIRREQPARRGFPVEARNYLIWLAIAAVGVAAAAAVSHPSAGRFGEFALLATIAATVQYFAVHTARNQVFHTGLAFAVAAAVLLPPQLAVLVCVIQHGPEWARQRYPWFIQTFNIVNYVLSALAAWVVWHTLATGPLDGSPDTRAVGAAVCAGLVFVAVNHALLARMLMLARGRSLRDTGLFDADALLVDVVLAAVGIAFAMALRSVPALAPITVLPLLLIRHALILPTLREQALKDHKTGLLNSRGIEEAGGEELVRARRFNRPLSVLMCDVDDLRGINTDHGHIAGDAALSTLADTLCTELREYDICGRFGGDEFVVVLPETDTDAAMAVARRVQLALAGQLVPAREQFTVHVSIGAATYRSEETLDELVARADAAMYNAKQAGGAAVCVAA
jgi:diguanylate cyclase (GGDEF)-like protein